MSTLKPSTVATLSRLFLYCSQFCENPRLNMGFQFCADCGNLLPISHTEQAGCECCSSVNQSMSDTVNLPQAGSSRNTYSCSFSFYLDKLLESVSESSTNTFPSELRDRRGVVKRAKPAHSTDTWSTIDVKCPKCHANQVRYTTLQLKSADEGSTVFYSCSECSER